MSEIRINPMLKYETFNLHKVWPQKEFQISNDQLEPLDDSGSSTQTLRITSGQYKGNVLKLMKLPDGDEHELVQSSTIYTNLHQTLLNAEALKKLSEIDETKVPKLVDQGIFNGTLATIETFMPDVLGNRGIIPKMRQKTREERIVFYKSLCNLSIEFRDLGVILRDNNNDFAFHTDSSAGVIDFGSSYVEGSDNNTTSAQKAEVSGIKSLAAMIDFVEVMTQSKSFPKEIMSQINSQFKKLDELQEAINSL